MRRAAGATTPTPGGKPKSPVRGWLVLAGISAVAAVLLIAFPAQREPSFVAFWQFLVEMLLVMPAVLVIMGLFAVWVPQEVITRYLGHGSGVRGMVIALIVGTLPTGPLYAAFPLTKSFLDKGASPRNIFVFMAAWACIKIPQELLELQFLGWRFTLARLVVTIAVIAVTAFVFQWLLGDWSEHAPKDA